jgi:hypothetical protein
MKNLILGALTTLGLIAYLIIGSWALMWMVKWMAWPVAPLVC